MRLTTYNSIDAQLDYLDTSLDFHREISCFAFPNVGIVSHTTNGSTGEVEFDWFSIKDRFFDLKNKNQTPQAAYMLHTHPMGYNRMSSTDRNMVYGWCLALWIPIYFMVLTEEEAVTYICSVNEKKKVERDLLDVSRHDDLCVELEVLVKTLYGLSKSKDEDFTQTGFDKVMTDLKEANMDWMALHDWNTTRKWNQVWVADPTENQ